MLFFERIQHLTRVRGGVRVKKLGIIILVAMLVGFLAAPAAATGIVLYDWAYYVDGDVYEYFLGDSMPTTGSLADGLGTLTWSTSTPGSHTFIAFFDHEIDEDINTYFNENGDTNGVLAAGQSWEIDEPGYVYGDIYDNVLAGALDNTNAVPGSDPDDVSMAMGWDFSIVAGEEAFITLFLSDTAPAGFYLQQIDPDSQANIFFSSTLDIRGVGVPEPATMLLLGSGLLGIAVLRRRLT